MPSDLPTAATTDALLNCGDFKALDFAGSTWGFFNDFPQKLQSDCHNEQITISFVFT